MVEVVPPPPPRRRVRPTRDQLKEAARARWREWKRMLDEGTYPSQSALARGEGVWASTVSEGLRKLTRS